jgi:transcriptional antiterminator RfaH
MDDQGPTWYAVHTKPRKEPLVNEALKRQDFETLFLHYGAVVKHARKTRRIIRAYFPRYVFVGVRLGQALYDVNSTMGVSTVVYLGDKPLEIPLPVIEELCARGNAKGRVEFMPKVQVAERARWAKGQSVSVVDGPLAGLLATVALDKGHEVRVWLEMFGGKVEALFAPEGLKSGSPVRGSMDPAIVRLQRYRGKYNG